MEIDRITIKALAAEKRLDILKSLKHRRKMPSELSRELNLAPSTIIEHLSILEKAGLVVRKDTGRKWIYYELSNKGENLIAPRFPVQFILMLSLGLIFVFAGFSKYLAMMFAAGFQESARISTNVSETGGATGAPLTIPTVITFDYLTMALIAIGFAFVIFAGYKILKK